MADQPPSTQWSAPPPPAHRGTGAIVAASFAGVALAGLAWAWQGAGWLVEQAVLQLDLPVQWWLWPLTAVLAVVTTVAPAVLLWRIPRSVSVRECGRAWFWAAVAGIAGTLPRVIADPYAEAYLGCLAVVFAALALAARRRGGSSERAGRPGSTTVPAGPGGPAAVDSGGRASVESRAAAAGGSHNPAAVALAVFAGAVVLLPWVALGALGGLLETILAAVAAAAAGWLAVSILDGQFWAPFVAAGRARLVLVGGLVAGVTLLLIAAGLGESGAQIAAMLVLPPLGFAVAALAAGSSSSAGWLVGLASLGPLAFVDPQELSLFLLGRDALFWIGIAALSSLLLGLLLGLACGPALLVRVASAHVGATVALRPRRTLIAAVVAVAMVTGAGAVYAVAGQPGLHGERLFVVMKGQAPLSGLPTTFGPGPGRDQRVAAVYRRLTSFANESQRDLRRQLDRWRVRYTPYYLVNGLLVDGGPLVRALLADRSDVDRVLIDPVLRPLPATVPVGHGDLTAPPTAVGWNIQMVGAPEAWQRGVTGRSIVVGSSDSGVDGEHPALRQGFRGGDDSWYDPWYGTDRPHDYNGHGTHTTATAVGRGGIGVAPDAQWVGCVNLGRNLGSPSHYLDCLQFMLAPFPRGGNPFTDGRPARAPHILTNSWGCPMIEGCDAGALRPATAALAAAGIAVVVAAGNSGPRCDSIIDPPAPYSTVITVAAVDDQRRVAQFSSRGPRPAGKPDLAAPGQSVVSALPGGTYAALSGTSMATPHVAGLIALLWSQRPELIGDLATTRRLLLDAAVPAADVTDACGGTGAQVGAGIAHIPPSR